MEDNNNQEIDFSSQPLGVVSQEGEKIEDNLNQEYARNEELRKQRNGMASSQPVVKPVPEEPLPDFINDLPNTHKEKPVSETSQVAVPEEKAETNTPAPMVQPNPVTEEVKVEEPVKAEPVIEKPEVEKPVIDKPVQEQSAPETKVEEPKPAQVATPAPQVSVPQVAVPLNQPTNNNPGEEKVSNIGIVFFILFIALLGGAIFVFTTGKADSLLGETEDYGSSSTPKESKKVEDPVETAPEEIRTFYSKTTLYATKGTSISMTSSGVVDMENRTAKYTQSGSLAGRYAKNITVYCDYKVMVCYYEDVLNGNKWVKEEIKALYLGPDEAYQFISSLATPEPVGEDSYVVNIRIGDVLSLAGATEDFTPEQQNIITKTELFMDTTGRIKRIRYDFTDAYQGTFDKVYGVLEYSDINKYGNVVIPEEIINSAS